MIKLYLHIGSTKTGSTALQSYLTHNKKALLTQGILYPDTFLDGVAHHKIASTLNSDQATIQTQFDKLHREIESSDATSVILSTETMFFLQDQKSVLAQMLDNYDVLPIVYLRRQDIWLEAMYTQTIKHEEYRFSDDIREQHFLSMYDVYMDYEAILNSWKNTFKNRIDVGIYETFPKRLNVISDFFAKLTDIDTSGFEAPQYERSANKSLTYSAIRFLRAANSFKDAQNNHSKLTDALTDFSLSVEEKKQDYAFLSEFEKKQLLKRYQESNKLVAQEFGIGQENTLFSVADLGSTIIPPTDQIDTQSLAKINYFMSLDSSATRSQHEQAHTQASTWSNSGYEHVSILKPDDDNDCSNSTITETLANQNIDVSVTVQDRAEQIQSNLDSLTRVNLFNEKSTTNNDSEFFQLLNVISEYKISALIESSINRSKGCTYVIEDDQKFSDLKPLKAGNSNHIVTSMKHLHAGAASYAEKVFNDSGYSEYVGNHLANNGLLSNNKTLSSETIGIANKMVTDLTNNWGKRVAWLASEYTDAEQHLDVEQALDICFSMAVVDTGLHVNQIC